MSAGFMVSNIFSTILRALCPLLFMFLVFKLVEFAVKIWWIPLTLTKFMEKQGIRGPPYKFLHGNNKEVGLMVMESSAKPMDFSHDIFPRVQPHFYSWIKIHGSVLLCWLGPKPQLIVTDPELIREILNNKRGDFQKPKKNSIVKRLLGDGLVSANGEKWVRHRKLANKAFNGESLRGVLSKMVISVEEMISRWRDYEGRDTEISGEFRVLTLDVISRTAFGSSYLQGKNMFDLLAKLGKIVASNVQKIDFPGSGLFQSKDEAEAKILDQQITKSIMKMIEAREKKVRNGDANGYGDDYFGMLLQSQVNSNISLQDIVDECKTFYLAGHETTSALLTWTVVLLAMHPEWQERARKEVIQVLGSNTPSIDGLAQLKIMNMLINESLRLYPPVLFLTKASIRKVRVGKFTIPSGMELVVPPLAAYHDPSQWGDDVNLFKPERFAQGVTTAASTQVSFIPFGYGPRICVGLNFATLEAKVALSMILRCYTFTLSPSYQHAPALRITMGPQHGAPIIIHSQ
ncbi:cytochrome P450 CYP749A22 isoform X3 [Amborella trichopoda]|uniref:cytochrome P450 CYP749A22 isoform X3 n=1 Tax=Amborella trichopoda TaxID=13333 RepID=UPI0009C03427|nr:cytochrome P450 CYP749A22 isoform X3 [Amborella trichopoda]|eukprot:XP_020530436.1 cytochrome P450 CYP749A22 isoform X3 [Amborella trichopoda]